MKPRITGFSMVEVLVTLVILSVGLLGVAGLMMQAQHVEFESYQRGQALMLVDEMAQRMINNRANVSQYVTGAVPGTPSLENCAAVGVVTRAQLDSCEWRNLLRGAAIQSGGSAAATALTNARGCITKATGSEVYFVEVVWAGRTSIGAPLTTCGQGVVHSNDTYRRSVTTTVMIPNLT